MKVNFLFMRKIETKNKALSLSIIFILVYFIFNISVLAQSTTPEAELSPTKSPQNTDEEKSALEQKIQEYTNKLNDARSQKNTLSSQINYMDTQIYVTDLKIDQTEDKISDLEREINVLGTRITNLDSSLDQLSEALIMRTVAGYKNRNINILDILLDSNNVSMLVNKLKYYQIERERNQKALLQVQEAKINFEEQKDLREKKAEQLSSLQDELQDQQTSLNDTKQSKKVLLNATQNDETKYAALLAEAKRQIAAFRSFVKTTGVGAISADGLGTGEGGWYLSQRDSRWASSSMGSSNESVLDVGCLITSISMVMRRDGVGGFTPANIASNSDYFLPGTAYMYKPSTFNGSWPNGKNYRNIGYSEISNYLANGTPVIAGVNGASHYVVLKKDDGGELIMNDPIYGPDKKVSDYYSLTGPYAVFE